LGSIRELRAVDQAQIGCTHQAPDVEQDQHPVRIGVSDSPETADAARIDRSTELRRGLDLLGAECDHVADRVDDGATMRSPMSSTTVTVALS